jgi:paraquat-inducible protein A
LTLMLAVVVLFDPRALWDIADAIDVRGRAGLPQPHGAPPAAGPGTQAR